MARFSLGVSGIGNNNSKLKFVLEKVEIGQLVNGAQENGAAVGSDSNTPETLPNPTCCRKLNTAKISILYRKLITDSFGARSIGVFGACELTSLRCELIKRNAVDIGIHTVEPNVAFWRDCIELSIGEHCEIATRKN